MPGERFEIAGSAVRRSESVRRVRPADPKQIVNVTIVIRRPSSAPSGTTREEIEQSLSADAGDISAVDGFVRRAGLSVGEVSAAKRTMQVEGTAQSFNLAFGIELAYFDGPNGSYLSYDGPLTVPAELDGRIAAVLGLHQEPIARSRI
jgi:hypothetical protein